MCAQMRRLATGGFALVVAVLAIRLASAGGGPERTLLVVNGDSSLSLFVANEYVRLRRLSANHVCYLRGIPRPDVISADSFRTHIWAPIREHLEREGLADAIDTIAYSVDFPYAVNFKADLDADPKATEIPANLKKFPVGSLTGMTYFAHRVANRDTVYQSLFANDYYRRPPGGGRYGRMWKEEQRLQAEALDAVRTRKYQKALEAFEPLLARYDGDWQTWVAFGLALAESGRAEEARSAAAAAVRRGLVDLDRLERGALKDAVHEAGFLEAWKEEARVAKERGAPVGLGFACDPRGGPHRYFLSTCLGYTGIRGNTVPEVLALLRRSAAADGTQPAGTVYLMVNKDIRSRTRQPTFEATVRALASLGRAAEILEAGRDGQDGKIPAGKPDVLGLVAGTAGFGWPRSKSAFTPGAIAEHLTSFGAAFRTAGQTKAIEFLRHGACGTSGTVVEPYAIAEKFPHPFLHVYYAEGCSLAEAFYQSVHGPYQLLILGDPLLQPFARFAEVTLAAPARSRPWRGAVEVRATVKPVAGRRTARLELWVDGRQVATGPPGSSLAWDTRTVCDGHHRLRLVAVDDSRVGTRSGTVEWFRVENTGRSVALEVRGGKTSLERAIRLEGQAPGAERVEVVQGGRVVAGTRVQGGRWKTEVPAARLGIGTVSLQARARSGHQVVATSAPATATIEAPERLDPRPASGPRLDGLHGELLDEKGRPRQVLLATLDDDRGRSVRRDLSQLGVKRVKKLVVGGEFQVTLPGLHQLALSASGDLALSIDGKSVALDRSAGADRPLFVPLDLSEGWHAIAIAIAFASPGAPELVAHLSGASVAEPLAGARVRHVPSGLAAVKRTPRAELQNGKAAAAITDGKRRGKAVTVPAEGLELHWKRPERRVAAVVLFPPPAAKKSPPWPRNWRLEARTGSGGWRPVKNVTATVLRPATRSPVKPEVPSFLKLTFKPASLKALRLVPVFPKNKKEQAQLCEVEVYRKR